MDSNTKTHQTKNISARILKVQNDNNFKSLKNDETFIYNLEFALIKILTTTDNSDSLINNLYSELDGTLNSSQQHIFEPDFISKHKKLLNSLLSNSTTAFFHKYSTDCLEKKKAKLYILYSKLTDNTYQIEERIIDNRIVRTLNILIKRNDVNYIYYASYTYDKYRVKSSPVWSTYTVSGICSSNPEAVTIDAGQDIILSVNNKAIKLHTTKNIKASDLIGQDIKEHISSINGININGNHQNVKINPNGSVDIECINSTVDITDMTVKKLTIAFNIEEAVDVKVLLSDGTITLTIATGDDCQNVSSKTILYRGMVDISSMRDKVLNDTATSKEYLDAIFKFDINNNLSNFLTLLPDSKVFNNKLLQISIGRSDVRTRHTIAEFEINNQDIALGRLLDPDIEFDSPYEYKNYVLYSNN